MDKTAGSLFIREWIIICCFLFLMILLTAHGWISQERVKNKFERLNVLCDAQHAADAPLKAKSKSAKKRKKEHGKALLGSHGREER